MGERLKERIFVTIFPHLAKGFLADRKGRLAQHKKPSEQELADIFEATLTLLYRLLFLLYAESRDLLPIREGPYYAASLKKIKEEIADKAGVAESGVAECLQKAYSPKETALYDRLCQLCRAMDKGDPVLNVPTYNGGLFTSGLNGPHPKPTRSVSEESSTRSVSEESSTRSASEESSTRCASEEAAPPSVTHDQHISRFLAEHKVPDQYLALAIDRLARDQDERTLGLVFIDYKSLEVRHLGSIYEGLLEFHLRVADEDLATQTDKKGEKYIPLGQAKASGRRKPPGVVVSKGEIHLSNDKAQRKASGSYYTPDPIVKYIVEQAVGPVLAEKLEALRPEFRKVRKTFDNELQKSRAYPSQEVKNGTLDHREWAGLKTYQAHRQLVERLFDFRVLDPAMGSGHFLVEAVDFITDRLLTFLNQFPVNPVTFMLAHTRHNILVALSEQGVSVDDRHLTDINLLKRHVLKRCIYGVDLNPMAVELAKVSLWLDAFTLGAPLSFLDHHLRCGNSLIGATFKHLAGATKGRLFGIDYEPLLRAVRHVLQVNKMADATAAEVKQSASEYDLAREELSGYQIVLDLLVAKHFGHPKAPGLLEHGDDLKLDSRARFMASLSDLEELALVERVEALARQPDRRFFHWEIEFPEVFFGFSDANERHLQHKNEIAEGSAGFDAVVGNPPYDELSEHAAGRELPEKGYFKAISLYKEALGGRLNVFRLFVVRALSVLRHKGRHSFIVPMALLADQFTAPLRRHMLTNGWLRSVDAFPQKDDPHNRVFFEAKLSTCVFVAENHGDLNKEITIRTYPGNSFTDVPRSCSFKVSDLEQLEPDGLSIPAIAADDLQRWRILHGFHRTARFSDVAKCYLGELMTNASNAHLTSDEPIGPRLLRGANINYYVLLDEPKQGEPLYLKEKQFLKEYADDIRSTHHLAERIGFQESSPIDNWRRLIACHIPAGHYCVHKIRYFATDAKYDIFAVLAIFNSRVTEWRFGLTSTNNSINAYEVDALPIPRFECLSGSNGGSTRDAATWRDLLDCEIGGAARWTEGVTREINHTPRESNSWPDEIHDALAAAGRELSRLGAERQSATNTFAAWLMETLAIDEERFSGLSYLRGGQAVFDEMGWRAFAELLRRNQRACGASLEKCGNALERRYAEASQSLQRNRRRFAELDAAVDAVMWQLVGLNADGSLAKQ